ncbi:unnamed protein product [Calicophoron daubneyi]|uniref:Glycolipid transfer protein domain-containing protein n=1 Tax=Calicophoron daubneyi TaxID=300641 RepID=A0AAV2T282_CALDB
MATEQPTFFTRFPGFGDPQILNTDCFIRAASVLPEFFSLWGSRFFLLKSDVNGNMKKIAAASTDSSTSNLKDLLAYEASKNRAQRDSSGSVGLLWLIRSFELLVAILTQLSKSDAQETSLRPIIVKAYDETLRKHHTGLMRKTFHGLREARDTT